MKGGNGDIETREMEKMGASSRESHWRNGGTIQEGEGFVSSANGMSGKASGGEGVKVRDQVQIWGMASRVQEC